MRPVASYGEDVVVLGFLLPGGLNVNLWEVMVIHADAQPETEDISFMFRVVRTILFLHRLCPSGAQEVIQGLGKELDESRTRSAIEIALKAERLLARELDADGMHVHPQILKNILRHGSWSSDDLVQQLWAGLLASSCSAEGTDESNREFIDLLLHITDTQAPIFVTGCRKANELMSAADGEALQQILISPEEMTQITGLYDRYRTAREVSHLFNFGLLENVFDFSTYIPNDRFDITPSSRGLELFNACKVR